MYVWSGSDHTGWVLTGADCATSAQPTAASCQYGGSAGSYTWNGSSWVLSGQSCNAPPPPPPPPPAPVVNNAFIGGGGTTQTNTTQAVQHAVQQAATSNTAQQATPAVSTTAQATTTPAAGSKGNYYLIGGCGSHSQCIGERIAIQRMTHVLTAQGYNVIVSKPSIMLGREIHRGLIHGGLAR